jgi:hypothetical protein
LHAPWRPLSHDVHGLFAFSLNIACSRVKAI